MTAGGAASAAAPRLPPGGPAPGPRRPPGEPAPAPGEREISFTVADERETNFTLGAPKTRYPPRQPGPSSSLRSPINAGDGVTRSDASSSNVVIRSPLISRRCTCEVPG